MATGPEHYQKAERLLDKADGQEYEQATHTIAKAQVHATLAQAAAVAMTGRDALPTGNYRSWIE